MPDHLATLLTLAHAGATWFMVGLIWFVQIVHYPLMATVPEGSSPSYAAAHQRRTTWVVGPVMLLEVACAALLFWLPARDIAGVSLDLCGAVLLGIVWASTFAVQVPLHARLATGFDRTVWSRLVTTNWLRTIAWSGRGIVALLWLS